MDAESEKLCDVSSVAEDVRVAESSAVTLELPDFVFVSKYVVDCVIEWASNEGDSLIVIDLGVVAVVLQVGDLSSLVDVVADTLS